jgi:pyrrolidone-carboxylate peptidase
LFCLADKNSVFLSNFKSLNSSLKKEKRRAKKKGGFIHLPWTETGIAEREWVTITEATTRGVMIERARSEVSACAIRFVLPV